MDLMLACTIARGDIPVSLTPLVCPLRGVPREAWTVFVHALESAPLDAVSDSNGLGCFEMRPRRLADLGLMVDLRTVRKTVGDRDRQVWIGEFVPPLTMNRFLSSPIAQYNALAGSIELYDRSLKLPKEMSRSGALAILHCAGPSGLRSWSKQQFPSTMRVYERARDIF